MVPRENKSNAYAKLCKTNKEYYGIFETVLLLLIGTKFQYSRKRRQDKEGKQSDKVAIRGLVLTFCPTMHSAQERKLKPLMPVL